MAAVCVLLLTSLGAAPVLAADYNVSVGCGSHRVANLIHLIEVANQRGTLDRTTIHLASNCTYALRSRYNNPARGSDGLPPIKRSVVIEGNGSEITRRESAPRFRILSVLANGSLTLRGLTLSNGAARNGRNGSNAVNADGGDGLPGKNGGAIYNLGSALLVGVVLSGNSAGRGGDGGSATGTPAGTPTYNPSGPGTDGIDRPDLTAGDGGWGGRGGAIYNAGVATIRESIIWWNRAGDGGAGGAALGGDGGNGSQGSTLGGDGGQGGGGISGASGAGGGGGAIFTSGGLVLSDTLISNNAAGDSGPAGDAKGGNGGDGGDGETDDGGAGGDAGVGYASATTALGGDGGAIYKTGSVNMIGMTIEFNAAGDAYGGSAFGGDGGSGGDSQSGGSGGLGGSGGSATGGSASGGVDGAIHDAGGTLDVFDTTFTGNTAGVGYGGNATGGSGGTNGTP